MTPPTAEQLEIQALAHDFAEAELRPHAAGWDQRQALDEAVFAKLAELGFLGMLVPEEHGGLGFDFATYLLVLEELAWGDASVALSVAIHNGPVCGLLARHGSAAQKAEWLPRLASGEILGAFAMSEAGSGSDPAYITTDATRDANGWLLEGEKRWVTNGARAGLVVVLARTEAGFGAFLVPTSADGYSTGAAETTLGLRASETVSARFDRVRVPADALIGEPDAGLRQALEALDLVRAGAAAEAVGVGRAALEHATRYALGREQFNQPIARFGAVQAKLADMAQRIAGARALAREAAGAVDAWQEDAGAPRTGLEGLTARAAIAKLAASEAATWVADEAVQIYGGYGYMRHYPVEKLLRDAKGAEIYEGTNEIMRMVIAREVLRDAGDIDP
jgi:alkylation response protein AidB-like acyl-CoA dehydrogenase